MRAEADRCPGLLRTFAADDGALVRLRAPGGRLAIDRLQLLMRAAVDHGAPFVQLTSRANLQIRGLADPVAPEFVEIATRAGFLPHPTHERVRNVVAAPWSRREAEIATLVAELDQRLCANPDLARLPGRVLIVVDDGSGQVLGLPYDLGYVLPAEADLPGGATPDGLPGGGTHDGLLLAAGRARPVPLDRAVDEIVCLAKQFVDVRESMSPSPWNLVELDAASPLFEGFTEPAPQAASEPPPGTADDDLVVGVPLGLLTPEHVDALAEVSDRVVLTPWRRLVLPGMAASDLANTKVTAHSSTECAGDLLGHQSSAQQVLARAGLVTTAGTGWDHLTACIGAPSCRRTNVPTLDLARDLVQHVHTRTHLSGCQRRCGTPSGQHIDLVAPAGLNEAIAHLGGSRA